MNACDAAQVSLEDLDHWIREEPEQLALLDQVGLLCINGAREAYGLPRVTKQQLCAFLFKKEKPTNA